MNTIIRHIKIWFRLCRFMTVYSLEYRVSFIFEIITELGYSLILSLVFLIIFNNTDSFVGWNYKEAIILIVIINIISELIVGLFHVYNLKEVPSAIVLGTMDQILVKPISTQFYYSVGKIYFTSVLIGVLWLIALPIVFLYLGFELRLENILGFLFASSVGLLASYSYMLLLTSLTFKFVNAKRLIYVAMDTIFRFGSYPHQVYRGFVQRLFVVYIPATFTGSIPAWFLLKGTDWQLLILVAIVSLFVFTIASLSWRHFISGYSSASS